MTDKEYARFTRLMVVFCFAGEEFLPQLQRVVHSDAAAVPEAGVRQTAHRFQYVHPLFTFYTAYDYKF